LLSKLYNIGLQRIRFTLIKRVMKTTLLIILAATTVLSSSCNTFIGLGRDLRIAGEGMEKTADKASGGRGSSADTSGAPVY
jgi:predicted small secreted protein